ncbi:hypothetical protein C5S35_18400 [Candidatus Methanophagaceae archaeon]|nr:hypothetical protein C5S35_18400 [Methanophagales archaeon]
MCIKIVYHAQHYVCGCWRVGSYGDRVGIGPVAEFRGGYVIKVEWDISEHVVAGDVGLFGDGYAGRKDGRATFY